MSGIYHYLSIYLFICHSDALSMDYEELSSWWQCVNDSPFSRKSVEEESTRSSAARASSTPELCGARACQYVNKLATDCVYEADGLESFIHTSSIKVEYYRSFEYCLKWEVPMSLRRSTRLLKASKNSPQRSPTPEEDVIQRRLRGKRQRTGLRKITPNNSQLNTDKGTKRDIIDIINSTHDAKPVAEEDEGKLVEVADEGVDDSDGDCCSVASSIASGPTFLHNATPKKQRPSQGMCLVCGKLYLKAKKMKAPIKNKLLDNDPKSLTCDQWVLIKNWRLKRLPDARKKLFTNVMLELVKKILMVKNRAKQTEGESSACSRPHIFLQRNLRQCAKLPVKKERRKNRRKRGKDSQGPRVAKQQRLHSNNDHELIDISSTDGCGPHPTSGHSSSHGLDGCSDQEVDNPGGTDMTVKLIPSAVTLETTKEKEVPPEQKAPKKAGVFRDLLAQLGGNSSMIVKETC